MVNIHEEGGCFKGDAVFSGVTTEEARKICPDLDVDGQNIDEGWWKRPARETK